MVGFELSNESSAPDRGSDAEGGTLHRLGSLKAQPGSHHHFSDVETVQLATFINARFADEPLLSSLLPVDGSNPDTFFDAWGDGMLLIVLVDAACAGAVDLAFLRRRARKPLGVSVRHLTIQHFAVLNDALEGCKNIEGLRLGFVGAEDFVQGNRPVILGVGWQLVRLAILQKVSAVTRPELTELFTPEEAEKTLGKLGQEELVLSRWFNHYLEAVGSDRQVWQFGAELADGVAWSTLLHAIDPSACPAPLEHDPETNARNVMTAVRKMGIKGVFLAEDGLIEADRKQNVMFCAQIMDAYPILPSREEHHSYKKNKESISSSHHSKGSTVSTLYTSSPVTEREASYSSAPPPPPPQATNPSPPKSSWGFGKDWGNREAEPGGEGKIYYDSDGEVESSNGCGLGLLGMFSCVTRN